MLNINFIYLFKYSKHSPKVKLRHTGFIFSQRIQETLCRCTKYSDKILEIIVFSQVQHFAIDFKKMTLSSYFKESMSYDGKKMCCGKHVKLNVYNTTWHND